MCAKKKKNTLFNNSSSLHQTIVPFLIVSHTYTTYAVLCQQHCTQICCLHCLRFYLNINKVSAHIRCLQMWYSPKWRYRGTYSWIVISFVFAHKNYSRCFITLYLNPWCRFDYFNNLLAMFLSLDHVRIHAVYGRVRELSERIKNIFICVSKMNKGLTGLERHEGE